MGLNKKDNPLYLGSSGKDFANARLHRKEMTRAENLLWGNLRNKRLIGFKFRRQHPIGGYIADFYCHEAKLVIEIDGPIHDLPDNSEYDEGRTYELESLGLKVIRFKNDEVQSNPEEVLIQIMKILEGLN